MVSKQKEFTDRRYYTLWLSALTSVGCSLEDSRHETAALMKRVDPRWHDFYDFVDWAEKHDILKEPKNVGLKLIKLHSGPVGPKNYRFTRGSGRPSRFVGVDFEWDPGIDDIRSEEGMQKLAEARAAGASWRECKRIFGLSHAYLHRLHQQHTSGVRRKPPGRPKKRKAVDDLLG